MPFAASSTYNHFHVDPGTWTVHIQYMDSLLPRPSPRTQDAPPSEGWVWEHGGVGGESADGCGTAVGRSRSVGGYVRDRRPQE
jgi:hypothetical protein